MTRLGRLQQNWVYGGFLSGLMLLALTPLLLGGWDGAAVLAFLVLPAYMLHQYEEHDDDRFHQFVITELGKGRDVLPTPAIFLINILGVWVVMVVTLWLMRRVGPGFGVVAGYLVLVNGIVHLIAWAVLRRYNPGLVTGIVLFLPLGIAVLVTSPAGPGLHLAALLFVVGVHAGIVIDARSKLKSAPLFVPKALNGGRYG
jgi:hypothetical protein